MRRAAGERVSARFFIGSISAFMMSVSVAEAGEKACREIRREMPPRQNSLAPGRKTAYNSGKYLRRREASAFYRAKETEEPYGN